MESQCIALPLGYARQRKISFETYLDPVFKVSPSFTFQGLDRLFALIPGLAPCLCGKVRTATGREKVSQAHGSMCLHVGIQWLCHWDGSCSRGVHLQLHSVCRDLGLLHMGHVGRMCPRVVICVGKVRDADLCGAFEGRSFVWKIEWTRCMMSVSSGLRRVLP